MSLPQLLFTLFNILIIVLLIVWWLRWTPRGLEWIALFLLGAIGLSYLSGIIFHVPPYQAGCTGLCPGWRGYPFPTHYIETGNIPIFAPVSFVRNVFFYYAILLSFGALVAWLARQFRWPAQTWKRRLLFILVVIVLPLATLPMWLPPPQPDLPHPQQRLAINAARNWRWQLHLRSFMDRRLAVEDVRPTPDGQHQRVCFRIYTWFYLPYQRAYIDLDAPGVQAIDGAEIPLSESCW